MAKDPLYFLEPHCQETHLENPYMCLLHRLFQGFWVRVIVLNAAVF